MAQKPRAIFEEVSDEAEARARPPRGGAAGGAVAGGAGGPGRGAVRAWLALLFVLVAAMVLVGGLTRLTDSGLSITEWAPIKGALPPMSEAQWQAEFEKYQRIPEFQLQNSHMDLAQFKEIYWWEWAHRFLGRFIGLVWAVGYGVLWATGRIPRGWAGRLALPGLLGAVQGAVGWWMVSSGLSGTRVDVASYRLATHLGLAFIILGLIAWYWLMLGRDEAGRMQARRARERRLYRASGHVLALAFVQILLGALVAGIDAGRSFVDWPWMGGQFFPPDAFSLKPLWRNFFENPGLVQFMHRITGYVLALGALWLWVRARRSPNPGTRRAFTAAALMVLVQVTLGIMTVLQAASLHIAITHQAGAILTWVALINARFTAGYPTPPSIRG